MTIASSDHSCGRSRCRSCASGARVARVGLLIAAAANKKSAAQGEQTEHDRACVAAGAGHGDELDSDNAGSIEAAYFDLPIGLGQYGFTALLGVVYAEQQLVKVAAGDANKPGPVGVVFHGLEQRLTDSSLKPLDKLGALEVALFFG